MERSAEKAKAVAENYYRQFTADPTKEAELESLLGSHRAEVLHTASKGERKLGFFVKDLPTALYLIEHLRDEGFAVEHIEGTPYAADARRDEHGGHSRHQIVVKW